ncbi:MAG: class I SAM-dependent methyltransferase [Bacteroidota bacterium]
MLTKSDKAKFRSTIFRHLDGIATATTAYSLYKNQVLDYILNHGSITLADAVKMFNANEGYLNVALRILASQGWLEQDLDNVTNAIVYKANDKTKSAFTLVPLYEQSVKLLEYSDQFAEDKMISADAFIALGRIFDAHKNHYELDVTGENSVEYQILKHIEGVILGPIIVLLGVNGLFHKYFMEASFTAEEYHKDPESFKKILDFLSHLGWFRKKKNTYQFTDKGLFFAKRASAYGVTVSYIPTFLKLDDLIFGDPLILKTTPKEPEKHVHREMNVWGSGGAHTTYFKVVDQVIINLFNRPIDEQPKGILDMGCGNGAFIEHIFDLIEQQTERGKVLDEYPLLLVGADFNHAALRVTRANLIKADIWAKVIWGDIGRPDLLADDLKEDYNIELSDLLNVRTFLDHNRMWESPKASNGRMSKSTGAYAHHGQRLDNNMVEASLLEHLSKWKPYVERFGLLVIELHTIDPKLAALHVGKTAATAYDATHGYSDQFIVEVDVFKAIAKDAGLVPDEDHYAKFPNSDLATVSVNLLKGTV